MPARLLILLLAGLLAVVPAACGDDEDVDTLLSETFSGDKQVDSGRLALAVRVNAKGSDQVQGPISLELAGPFQREEEGELPRFDLDATLSGQGMTYKAGAVSVGGSGFISFQDQDYALSEAVFEQFRQGFKEGRAEKSGEQPADLATLGIDPRKWLTNARNEGDAKVGDADTIRITGDVDVPKLIEDLVQAGAKARQLDPGDRAGLPSELTERRRREIAEAIDRMRVEIFTGEEDRILRRIVLSAAVRAPADSEDFDTADVRLAYEVTELNEDQEIEAPKDPRPFAELERQLSSLGLGGASAARGSGADRRELRRYTRCVERAGEDRGAVQKCADLL